MRPANRQQFLIKNHQKTEEKFSKHGAWIRDPDPVFVLDSDPVYKKIMDPYPIYPERLDPE